MNNNKTETDAVQMNYILNYACDRYLDSIVKKCDSNIENWKETIFSISANICFLNKNNLSKNIIDKICPNLKLLLVNFCICFLKFISKKYIKNEQCVDDILEINKLIKTIKIHYNSDDLDELSAKVNFVSDSSQVIATLNETANEITNLFENFIKYCINKNGLSEIFTKYRERDANISFVNFINDLSTEWLKINSVEDFSFNVVEMNSDLKLLKIPRKSKKIFTQIDSELVSSNSEFEESSISQISQHRARKTRRKWSEKENANLIEGIKEFGIGNWTKILKKYPFEGRTNIDLFTKFRVLSRKDPTLFQGYDSKRIKKTKK